MFASLVTRYEEEALNSGPAQSPDILACTRKRGPPSLRAAHNGDSVFAPAMNTPAAQKQAVRSARRQLFRADARTQERASALFGRVQAALEDPPVSPHLYTRFARVETARTTGHNMLYVLLLHPFVRC